MNNSFKCTSHTFEAATAKMVERKYYFGGYKMQMGLRSPMKVLGFTKPTWVSDWLTRNLGKNRKHSCKNICLCLIIFVELFLLLLPGGLGGLWRCLPTASSFGSSSCSHNTSFRHFLSVCERCSTLERLTKELHGRDIALITQEISWNRTQSRWRIKLKFWWYF